MKYTKGVLFQFKIKCGGRVKGTGNSMHLIFSVHKKNEGSQSFYNAS